MQFSRRPAQNPQQLCANPRSAEDLASLRKTLVLAHKAKGDRTEDLLLGLQLTHSGRFSPPARRASSADSPLGIPSSIGASESRDDRAMLTDDELDGLIGDLRSYGETHRGRGPLTSST